MCHKQKEPLISNRQNLRKINGNAILPALGTLKAKDALSG